MENQTQTATTETTSDERLLGMLSHLSIVLGGIILPIIIWATQKDKSKFVRFHSLQSIFFHIAYLAIILVYIIIFAGIVVYMGFGTGLFDSENGKGEMPTIVVILMILIYGGIFLLAFGGIGYAIYLAIKTYKGALIKIPIIGNIVYKKVYGPI